ncbi:hypothetical protein [Enterococcus termitis]|nr:hypothetical protein [Enterococcus termitis]
MKRIIKMLMVVFLLMLTGCSNNSVSTSKKEVMKTDNGNFEIEVAKGFKAGTDDADLSFYAESKDSYLAVQSEDKADFESWETYYEQRKSNIIESYNDPDMKESSLKDSKGSRFQFPYSEDGVNLELICEIVESDNYYVTKIGTVPKSKKQKEEQRVIQMMESIKEVD